MISDTLSYELNPCNRSDEKSRLSPEGVLFAHPLIVAAIPPDPMMDCSAPLETRKMVELGPVMEMPPGLEASLVT